VTGYQPQKGGHRPVALSWQAASTAELVQAFGAPRENRHFSATHSGAERDLRVEGDKTPLGKAGRQRRTRALARVATRSPRSQVRKSSVRRWTTGRVTAWTAP